MQERLDFKKNLKDDFNTHRLDHRVLRIFSELICESWGKTPHNNAYDVFLKVVAQNDKKLCCKRKQSPEKEDIVRCSRVMSASSFINHNTDRTKTQWSIVDEPQNWQIKMLERNLYFKLYCVGKLRGRLPIAWITKTCIIDNERNKGMMGLADRVRNILGMSGYGKTIQLVELRYPSDAFDSCRVAAPTFLDGGGFPYRSFAATDGFGRAIDLSTGDRAAPEAVHEELTLDTSKGFSLSALGVLVSDAPAIFPLQESVHCSCTTQHCNVEECI